MRPSRFLPPCLAALLLSTLPSTARGECDLLEALVLPSEDTGDLPTRPSLFVFVPRVGPRLGPKRPELRVEDARGLVTVRWQAVRSAHDGMKVYRAVLGTPEPGELRVSIPRPNYSFHERVHQVEERPSSDPKVSATILAQDSHDTLCPSELTRRLVMSVEAPAYRVVFARSRKDWLAGRTRSIVVPGQPERQYSPQTKSYQLTGRHVAVLGSPSCFGVTFPWRQEVYLGLSALRTDGTETPLPREPTRVKPPCK